MERLDCQEPSLMRQTLLEALLSVQLLRRNVQQSIRDLQAECLVASEDVPSTLHPINTPDAANLDSPGPPSPSPIREHMYPNGQLEEQAFSNVLFQNVLFQDAWTGQGEEGEGLSDHEASLPEVDGDQHDGSLPVLAHAYSPAISTNTRQAAAPSSSTLPGRHSTPLRAALNKLNDRGENGFFSAAFGFDSPPQAERNFQRSARSSMDAAAFFMAARRDPHFPRRNNGNDTSTSPGTFGVHDATDYLSRRPPARKNLASTSLNIEAGPQAGQKRASDPSVIHEAKSTPG